MSSLAGRACVVTGASSGVGYALAVALARAGADVWALGRDEDRLDSLVASAGDNIVPLVVDLESDDELERVASELLSNRERFDVLVHSAGAFVLGGARELSTAEFDRQVRVNLRAPFVLTQSLLPALRRAHGQVVFINSSAALKASPSNVLYAATKQGLKAFADGLRDEVNPDGVRVTSLYLGRTASPMQESVHSQEGRRYHPDTLIQPDDVVGIVLASLLIPKTAEVTDVSIRPMQKLPTS
jgi:short-subunit dehydrogenase